MVFNNQSALYAESVVDVSDIAEEVSNKEGGFYKYSRAVISDLVDTMEASKHRHCDDLSSLRPMMRGACDNPTSYRII
jgi:hypothetical protein